jgi:hypothetical protein
MADTKEQSGGIVTVTKTESTSDLDVLAILAAQKEEAAADGDGEVTPDADETKETPGEVTPSTGKADDESDEDDDDEKPLDFKTLSPKEQKLVAKALQTKRAKDKKELRELRDKTTALESEIAGLKKGTAPKDEPAPVKKAETLDKPVRPKLKDYIGREEEYDQAMEAFQEADYTYRKAKEAEEARATAQQIADAKVVSDFNEKAEKFMETHPDYEDVMDSDVPLSPIMFGAMLENGPELGYWFGTNPEEALKISKMADRAADKAIMKIVFKLEEEAAKGSSKAQTASSGKKPEPPVPVKAGTAKTVVAKDPSKMTFKEREREFAKTHPGVLNYEP